MCRFVTSGTTVGNQIMMLVAKRLGGRVLLSRGSHRSLFAALELFEVPSVFFTDEEEIPALLKANPDIAAVIVTYPDYYGRFCQIEALAQAVHAAGALPVCRRRAGESSGLSRAFACARSPAAAISIRSRRTRLACADAGILSDVQLAVAL